MKKLLFLFVLATMATIGSFAQGTFSITKHSFGKIKQGTPVTYLFSFKNNTAKPLIIETATAECGCTTPEYPKEPIAKGKDGKIKITYNAAMSGVFTKHVNVKFAGVDAPTVLTIEGEVIAKSK
ncbi:MAG: DUF1573 domain-containing protein [Sphingobacteriia bacterium]|nr:DUF1573 domain-containing protein [Sphingobacteriia bacterium]